MPSRHDHPAARREPARLHEYRGRESYEEQSPRGRGGQSAAFPQGDYPRYPERHPQPFGPSDDYTSEDDYSRTDYGPLHTPEVARDRMRENQRFVNGALAPDAHPQARRGQRRSDERVYEDVCDRLHRAIDLDVRDVGVEVWEGEVSLRGSIPDRLQKHRAENLAADVAGVLDVHNGLRVQRPGTGRA